MATSGPPWPASSRSSDGEARRRSAPMVRTPTSSACASGWSPCWRRSITVAPDGRGCWLDVSQAEAGIQFLAPQIADAADTGRVASPLGNRDPQFAPHGVFACAGGDQWVAIVAQDDHVWSRLAEQIGGEALDAGFATLTGRKTAEDRLEAIVEAWTRSRARDDIEITLQASGCRRAPSGRQRRPAVRTCKLLGRGHFVSMRPSPRRRLRLSKPAGSTSRETPGPLRATRTVFWPRQPRGPRRGSWAMPTTRSRRLEAALRCSALSVTPRRGR